MPARRAAVKTDGNEEATAPAPTTTRTKKEREDALTGRITLRPREEARAIIPVVGLSPVIPHKWSEKAKRLMLEAQQGTKVRGKREAKIPEEEAEAALYRLDDGTPGMPATAFKAAIVGASRLFEGVTMTALKVLVTVDGIPSGQDLLVPIRGPLEMREDTPRNASGVADLRYRYQIWPWSAELEVSWVADMLDLESVVNLVHAAGRGGVGDWRPSAPKSLTGTYGRFGVDEKKRVRRA